MRPSYLSLFATLLMATGFSSTTMAAGIAQKVQFAPGQSQAQYQGNIQGQDFDRYTFYAQKGQQLNISTDGSNPNIVAVVNYLGKNSTDVLATQNQVLPYNGRYEVRVMQTRNGARQSTALRPYQLNIAITGTAESKPTKRTQKAASARGDKPAHSTEVRFKAGSSNALYRGSIRGYSVDRYVLRANQGQVLRVDTEGSNNYIVTTVSAIDDQGNLNALPEGTLLPSSSQTLPHHGLYAIEVMQMRAGARDNQKLRPYRLNIDIR